MVSAQLDAVESHNQIIVDGPFAKHPIFLSLLAQLRRDQPVFASDMRDGTAAGAACLALLNDLKLPHLNLDMLAVLQSELIGLEIYHEEWFECASP